MSTANGYFCWCCRSIFIDVPCICARINSYSPRCYVEVYVIARLFLDGIDIPVSRLPYISLQRAGDGFVIPGRTTVA